uniref:Heat shock protein 70 n=1 Tax=Panagrolaimus sp. ES5 TaxID=591445 RepID=A0AC34FY34_9BILA
MKEKTEEFHGEKLSKVVITIPADFNEAQREATFKAALLAGWKEIKLLPEPIAAAFAYFIESPLPTNSTVLLFDLGGGTLDVCIFKYQNFQIQIICNIGDSKLGGRNYDTVLINYFTEILARRYGISIKTNEKKYNLMIECQEIKETLSILESTSLDVDIFDPTISEVIHISREEFQSMTQPLINKIKNILKEALNCSGIAANEIEKVLQVGGGSRMPMIKDLLVNTFPFAVQLCNKNPDEVVAVGAAYFANSIFSNIQ